MATITVIDGGTTATGTFSAVETGRMVFTSTTLGNGATLTATQPWAGWIDQSTATTVRIPVERISAVA